MAIPIPYNQNPHMVSDPLHGVWPATLAIELALTPNRVKEVCEAYGIEREQWETLKLNTAFQAELKAAVEALRQEGAAFKVRAQMQAQELLKVSWAMIHDSDVPAAVRADLLKHTVKVAGLDASKDQGVFGKGGGGSAFSIVLNLSGGQQADAKIIQGN